MRRNIKMNLLIVTMAASMICAGCNGSRTEDSTETESKSSTTISEDENNIEGESSATEENTSNDSTTTKDTTTSPLDSDESHSQKPDVETSTTIKETNGNDGTSESTTTSKTDNTHETTTQSTTSSSSGSSSNNSNGNQSHNTTENELSKLVDSILKKCIKSSMSQLEKVIAIHDYLTYNVDYDYDNYLAGTIPWESYDALGTLKYGKAVCSGYAYAFYELAKEAGLDVKYISGSANNGSGNGYQGHAWNQVKVDGVWYNIDTTWDDPTYVGKKPDDHSNNSYSYCLISDTTLEKDHRPDSYDKATCSKDYDTEGLAKAIASTNTFTKSIYASSETELKTKLTELANSGCESFNVYMGHGVNDTWNAFDKVLASTKKPLHLILTSGDNRGVTKYIIGKKEDTYCITSLSDMKDILDKNKNKLDKIEFWYYDDNMTESTIDAMVNAELVKAGYKAELYSRTEIRFGMVQFWVVKNDNILIMDDFDELKKYAKNHSKDDLMTKKVMYIGDQLYGDELGKAVYDALLSNGYYAFFDSEFSNGVTKVNLYDIRDAAYVKNTEQIIDLINANGISYALDTDFMMYYGAADYSDALNKMILEISLKTGNYYSYAYNYSYGYITLMLENIDETIYISDDIKGLKADIQDAQSKGILEQVGFWYVDETGDFGGKYASVDELIAATGCNVNVYVGYYNEDGYHYIYLTPYTE